MKSHAVIIGRVVGIYRTWDEAGPQVLGFSGNKYQGFRTRAKALEYYNNGLAVVEPAAAVDREREDQGERHVVREGRRYGPGDEVSSCQKVAFASIAKIV